MIDPRTLRPLDLDTILESVRKTNRCVIVEEGWPHGGVGANLAALVQEQAFDYLDAPVQRVTGADVPMPYSKALEQAAMPHEEHVVKAALATFRDVSSDLMATDVIMPRLSDSMEEGTILRWLKSVGDEVKRGDELVEIETDKANMTYEATDEGALVEIVADEGDTLPIGEVIARIGEPERSERRRRARRRRSRRAGRTAERRRRAAADGSAKAQRPPSDRAPAASGNGRVKASPVARRMARDLNVQLESLQGSGPGGRIVKADVEAAAGEEGRPRGKPADGSAAGRRTSCARARDGQGRGRRSSSSRASSRRSRGAWPSRRRPCRTSTSRPRST